MCTTTCEASWLRRILQDVGEEHKDATLIICDKDNSIKLANNPLSHKNTKRFDT